MHKNSKKYGLIKGHTYPVMRNVNNECVIIVNEGANAVMSINKLKSYGSVVGTPQLGIASGGCIR